MEAALLSVGRWQLLAPRRFYETFPGFGRSWVTGDGPYNEHLLRDAGSGTLPVAAVVLFGLARPSATSMRTAAVAGLVFGGAHLVYHAAHVELLSTVGDRVAQSAVLAIGLLVPALLLIGAGQPGWTGRPRTRRLAPAGGGRRSRSASPIPC